MSEGVSAIVRSNQPASLKRRRAEDLDSGGSVGQPWCRFKGCTSGRQDSGTWGSREFCSKSHRDYFNAEVFDFVKNGVAHVTEEPNGICKLLGCELPVWETHDFCKAGHAVKYREDMTEKWELDNRLCKLQTCSHHVHVDEKSKIISEYCCREHQFDAAAARGKQAAAAKRKLEASARIDVKKDPVSSDEIRQISQEAAQQLQAKLENQRGYHDKVSGDKTMENCLIHLLANPGDFEKADPSRNFCRVESLDFHPFDDVTEFEGLKPKWYLHYIDSKKGRERFTKEGFGWKQKGREHVNKGTYKPLKSTYFTYELKPSSKVDSKDRCDGYVLAYRQYEEAREAKKLKKGTETRWKMSQYSLPDNIVMEVTGETLPSKLPVISKIYQDKDGQPVWPPLPQEKENRGGEVLSNKHTTSVPVEGIPVAHCHVEQRGMTSSVSSNVLPPGEGLPPGREKISQKPYLNEFEEFDSFLQDSLGDRLLMDAIEDESNAIVTLGTIPAVRFQEERGMTSSSPSSQAFCEGLPPLNCDDSSPSSQAIDEGLPQMNLDCSIFDELFDWSEQNRR